MVAGDKPEASGTGFSDDRESRAALLERQRLQDKARLSRIALNEWAGKEYEELREELATHGFAVLMSLVQSGEIAARCNEFGRPIRLFNQDGEICWTYDDRRSIVNITVASALDSFIEKVLKPGQWKADGGASLKTFFANWCERQFPNQFNTWRRSQGRWDEVHDFSESLEDREADLLTSSDHWSDPTTADLDTLQARIEILTENIDQPAMRTAAFMRSEGYSLYEISSEIGLSENVISNRFSRMKSKRRFNRPRPGPET